jgi:glyceraldehyde-3-phosphate dehydrogenase (NAD(P))
MDQRSPIRVAVNGYGVIGKRVADAVRVQEDMDLVGVSDVATDWRLWPAQEKGIPIYGADSDTARRLRESGVEARGTLHELLAAVDVVVDCTPKRIAAGNVEHYREHAVKFILQGGEKHAVTGHSFVAESSFESAIGRQSTRVVSCNTTSVVRTLTALKSAGLLIKARGTLLRRATDPWESDQGGIMNTLVPEAEIASHQGPDAQSVDPELDVVTMAVKVPETIGHLHYWSVQLTRPASKPEVLDAFAASTRIATIRVGDGLTAINAVKELTADLGRPRGDLYEVALWEDMLSVRGDELFYAYMVDNQAIVIPETVDAIRALSGSTRSGRDSIARTDAALGIRRQLR